LASGAAQLADGTDTLAAGTQELNSKVPTLASGVAQLDDGASQVADGADQLADGLGAAADGSGQLADGLAQAEPGGAQIEDGAGQLKEQGADELAKTGKEAQLGYAKNVALLEAAQQAGLEGAGIPFGPAEGTDVVTTAAYKMYLSGVAADTENNALKFGLGALLIAGAGGVAFAAARKLAA
jgi:putative membrane protein